MRMQQGGIIVEPDPPKYARDLSGYNYTQCCLVFCALPTIIFIQVGKVFMLIFGGLIAVILACFITAREFWEDPETQHRVR